MAGKGITKSQIVEIINQLMAKNVVPTAATIRQNLGKGSLTTIQKYFKEWKVDSFKKSIEPRPLPVVAPGLMEAEKEQNLLLCKKVLHLEEHIQALAHELIKKEQESLTLNRENVQLNQNLSELTEIYKQLSIKFEEMKAGYTDLKDERETTLQKILDDKNKQIQRLSNELKDMNQVHLNMIREIGRAGDDLMIMEKVKTINLSENIKSLQAEVKALEDKWEQANKANVPLQQEIKKQKALIKQFISWEQLQAYEQQFSGKS